MLFTNNLAQLGLNNFKPQQQGDASSRKKFQDPNNPKKWGDQIIVSANVSQELIFRLSDELNLDEELTFNLLDSYFVQNQSEFTYLIQIDKQLDQIAMDLQGTLPLGYQVNPQQYYAEKIAKRDRYTQEFYKTVNEISQNAVNTYFEERRCILQSLFLIYDASLRNDKIPYAKQLMALNVAENLIKSLEMSMEKIQVWQKLKNQREVILNLQREEILIMKCLFQNFRHHQLPDSSQILRFMKYLIATDFRGYITKQKQMIIPYQSDGQVKAQQTIITDFDVLNALNLLQIHLFAEQNLQNSELAKKFVFQLSESADNFNEIKKLFFEQLRLTNLNTPVFLAYRQILGLITQLDLLAKYQLTDKQALYQFDINARNEEVKGIQFMDQINEMNETHKYFEEEFQDRRGELNFLIQDWLNLIYPFLSEQKMEDEQHKAQKLAYSILENPIHLKSIWEQVLKSEERIIGKAIVDRIQQKLRYNTLDIFESIMTDPLENIGDFTLLMIALCGDKGHAYEHRVVELLKQYKGSDIDINNRLHPRFRDRSLLQIILMKFESFTVSIDQAALSDTDFLQYVNICILLGKIISHNALYYEELNSEFLYCIIDDEYAAKIDIKSKKSLRGNCLFSKDFPAGFIDERQRIQLNESFIGLSLTQIYQPLIQNYFSLNYRDVDDFSEFSYRLFKLTNILLSKYKDVNPFMRAPISHRLPQFDIFLHNLTKVFNESTPIENILTSVLLLSEDSINGIPSGLQNKFLIEQLQKGKTDAKHKIKIVKIIRLSLRCYNTLLELCYINAQIPNLSQEQLGQIGARTYYLTCLNSVQSVTSFVLSPGLGPSYQVKRFLDSEMSFSLFNVIQYYVKPSLRLCPMLDEVQIQAIKFFINCCNIWDVPSTRAKVSLESLLRTSGYSHSEMKSQYIRNFIEFSRKPASLLELTYLSTFLELLIISASTQQPFLEDLLKEQDFTNSLIDFIKLDLARQKNLEMIITLQKNVQSKLIILLSGISMNRIAHEFMKKITEADTLKLIYDNIITKQYIGELKRNLEIDFTYNLSEEPFQRNQKFQYNSKKSLDLNSVCQSLLTLKYYFQLLQDEYQRNLENKNVRQAITSLFDDQQVTDLQQMLGKSDEIYSEIHALNRVLLQDHSQRNDNLAKQYYQEAVNHLMSNELKTFIENSKLMTNDFFVIINNLDGSNLYNYLSKQPAYSFLTTTSLDLYQYSKLGSQFVINTDEFLDILRTYYYSDELLLSQAKIIASKYNMMVSYLYSYSELSITIKNFVLSVGKARTRENLRNKEYILKDRVMNTSLFVLADSNDLKDIIVNEERVKGIQNTLSKNMIHIAKNMNQSILKRIQQSSQIIKEFPQNDYPKLCFEGKQLETDLDFLTILFGIINNLSTIATFSQDNIKQLEQVQELVKALPQIRQLQLSSFNLIDAGKTTRIESEYTASKTYVNLVLQLFSICIIIQKAWKEQQMQRDVVVLIRDQQSDREYIKIVSSVLRLMQENYCFTEGIMIFEQALTLIANDDLITFMKRQDNPPLRIIIQKFLNANSTLPECIKIIEFLISFTKIDQGAELLNQENILQCISISSILSKVNSQDLYITEGENKRNQIHVLWCYILVFIRALNSKLMNDFEYRKTISQQLRLFENRVIQVLEIGAVLYNSTDKQMIKNALSLALYEELDLITGCLQQIFDYVDQFEQQDFRIYARIKDTYLYSVIHLFELDFKIKQGSSTEHYLNGIVHEKMKENIALNQDKDSLKSSFTGFDLLVQVEKIRIFLHMNSSMMNMLIINQQQKSGFDLLNTWDRREHRFGGFGTATPRRGGEIDNISQSHSVYTSQTYYNPDLDFDELQSLNYLSTAVYNYLQGLNQINKIFKYWVSQEQTINELYKDIYGLFRHDDWINGEYLGLNHFLGGNTFKEIFEEFEASLQMGYLTCVFLLQNLIELQKEKESLIGGRVSTTLKELMDYGENIKKQYAEFFSDLKKSYIIKPSIDTLGDSIKKIVDSLKSSSSLGYDKIY